MGEGLVPSLRHGRTSLELNIPWEVTEVLAWEVAEVLAWEVAEVLAWEVAEVLAWEVAEVLAWEVVCKDRTAHTWIF